MKPQPRIREYEIASLLNFVDDQLRTIKIASLSKRAGDFADYFTVVITALLGGIKGTGSGTCFSFCPQSPVRRRATP
jgi:hypothetical protein